MKLLLEQCDKCRYRETQTDDVENFFKISENTWMNIQEAKDRQGHTSWLNSLLCHFNQMMIQGQLSVFEGVQLQRKKTDVNRLQMKIVNELQQKHEPEQEADETSVESSFRSPGPGQVEELLHPSTPETRFSSLQQGRGDTAQIATNDGSRNEEGKKEISSMEDEELRRKELDVRSKEVQQMLKDRWSTMKNLIDIKVKSVEDKIEFTFDFVAQQLQKSAVQVWKLVKSVFTDLYEYVGQEEYKPTYFQLLSGEYGFVFPNLLTQLKTLFQYVQKDSTDKIDVKEVKKAVEIDFQNIEKIIKSMSKGPAIMYNRTQFESIMANILQKNGGLMLLGEWPAAMENFGVTLNSEFFEKGRFCPLLQGLLEVCVHSIEGFQVLSVPVRKTQTTREYCDFMQELSGQSVTKENMIKIVNSGQNVNDCDSLANILSLNEDQKTAAVSPAEKIERSESLVSVHGPGTGFGNLFDASPESSNSSAGAVVRLGVENLLSLLNKLNLISLDTP